MLSNLNDDCLLQIFELLPLKDQVEITDACERFQYLIVYYIWSKKYTDLHTQMRCLQPLNLQQYKKFFRANKENIHKLEIIEDKNNFVYVYNSNRLNERPDYTFYFGLRMTNLKTLKCPHERACDSYIKMLGENFPKLEYFCFGKGTISGAYLDDMRYLQLFKVGRKSIQMPLSLHEYEDIIFYDSS